jgi:hypothetical protein
VHAVLSITRFLINEIISSSISSMLKRPKSGVNSIVVYGFELQEEIVGG